MDPRSKHDDKALYRQLRQLRWNQLWREHVPRFNTASKEERRRQVSLIRAAAVLFAEGANASDLEPFRAWLHALLKDEDEKIRRYAIAALPKIPRSPSDEEALLRLWRSPSSEREKEALAEALEKLGGSAALAELGASQRITAREQPSGELNLDARLTNFRDVQIDLRGRVGLENFVREEVEERGGFRVEQVRAGLVAVKANKSFSLNDLFKLRCYGFLGFLLGRADGAEKIAEVIASPLARQIFQAFTNGNIRYRIEVASQGHQRALVKEIATRVYEHDPTLLNSGAGALWTVVIRRRLIELLPRMIPDPRFTYRQDDVPAASHPPLAACMARLAGRVENDIVWDPFCGSGLELIERGLFGSVHKMFGTDLSAEAIAIAQKNLVAAGLQANLSTSDFRAFNQSNLSLIITNPPLGKRVPIRNLPQLFADLFAKSAQLLRANGRLVLTNPFPNPISTKGLSLEHRQQVDFGGFSCLLEKYRRL